jgi:hypothetical protein
VDDLNKAEDPQYMLPLLLLRGAHMLNYAFRAFREDQRFAVEDPPEGRDE